MTAWRPREAAWGCRFSLRGVAAREVHGRYGNGSRPTRALLYGGARVVSTLWPHPGTSGIRGEAVRLTWMSGHSPISTTPVMEPHEKHRGGTDPVALSLAASIHRHAEATPGVTALVVEDREYSFAELADAASRIAAWLGPAMSRSDVTRVGILASRSFETFAGLVGTAWTGACAVPLNPAQPPARLASILRGAGLQALVVDRLGASLLGHEAVATLLPGFVLTPSGADTRFTVWSQLPPRPRDSAPVAVAPGHPAYVMHTSGTTGLPKGVVVTAASVDHFLGVVRGLYAFHPGDRVGQFCEPSFDVSVFEIYAAWDAGASLHVVPENRRLAPAAFIRERALTVWTSVPSVITILQRMKMLQPGSFPSLRISFFIGEALATGAAEAWQKAAPNSVVDNHYGPTEATVACTMQRLTDPAVTTPGRGTMAIGLPYAGMEAEVADDDGRFLASGETGELLLHGPQVADGYLGNAAETARRFVVLEHPRFGRTRWYRTGDLGYRDDAGLLHCLGRVDNQVKISGHRVELEDLEAHLRAAAACDDVAAIAWPVVDGQVAGTVGFVCGSAASPAGIRERLRELVPAYMLPKRVVAVAAIPRTANGKTDREALAAMIGNAA